jgi:limonene-1,2-epoxide hydrolase
VSDLVVDRIVTAINNHDVDAMIACLGADYRSEQPLHPEAGFGGGEQVAENWTALFDEISDLVCEVVASSSSDDEVWNEWHIHGHHRNGDEWHYRGVVIFTVVDSFIVAGRFYFDVVQESGPDIAGRTKEILES